MLLLQGYEVLYTFLKGEFVEAVVVKVVHVFLLAVDVGWKFCGWMFCFEALVGIERAGVGP
jgi:hypothetical protein